MLTSERCQPFAFADGEAAPKLIVGAVRSSRTVTDRFEVLPAASRATQVTTVPWVSFTSVTASQPVELVTPTRSVMVHWTDTGCLCHPAALASGVIESEIAGGVLSTTKTFALAEPSFPAASVAMQMSAWLPI